MSILGWQTTVDKEMKPALPGQVIQLIKARSYMNSGGTIGQVTVIDIGTIAAGNYVVKTQDQTVTVPILATDTQAQARDKIITALRANVQVYGAFIPEVNSGTSLKLTARASLAGINVPVTVSGGGAGFSINNASIAAANSSPIPYGGVIAIRAGDPVSNNGVEYCRPASLATDTPVAFAPLVYTNEYTWSAPAGREIGGIEIGELWARVEDPAGIAKNGNVYYRHTADGALNVLSICSGSAGTGKSQFTGCLFKGPAISFEDGMYIAPVAINR
jgi:hypothetical protein